MPEEKIISKLLLISRLEVIEQMAAPSEIPAITKFHKNYYENWQNIS